MTSRSKRSIRGKLTRIIMLTSTIAVLLACLGFVVSDLVSLRSDLADDLSTLAQVVGSNSIAALTFGDRQGAREALDALAAKPSIIAAAIYTDRGEPFARYQPDAAAIPRVLPRDGFHDNGQRLELIYGIRLRNNRVGTIYIVSDSRDQNARLKHDAEIAALIVLGALLFAFVLSSRLQNEISVPIVELARVAGLVSQHKNYSLRANPRRSQDTDEINDLMRGFNNMLAEIERRDDQLLVSRSEAEEAALVSAHLAHETALILNSTTDGIIGIGLDNRVTFLNPAASELIGMTLSDLKDLSIHQAIHHSHPDGTPWPEAECSNTLQMRRGQTFDVMDDTFWRRDGTSFPVEYSSRPIFDEDETERGAVVVFRDVTERRAIDRLKSEFVSTVSHELRTPLTSIRGALGLLGSGLLGPLQEKGKRMLDIAVSNTDRLVRLINDILDLERIGSGKIELARAAVDAQAVMVQASQGLQSMADQAGISLVVIPASGTLSGDSDRIIQTLTNLIGNAIKFSPPGTTVTVSGTARPEEFVFCVADEGRGVPEDKLETIFERFSQVDASDSRAKGGTGLGLAICQTIVRAHGGRIWAEKNDPAGSRFQFTIPLNEPLGAQLNAPLPAPVTAAVTVPFNARFTAPVPVTAPLASHATAPATAPVLTDQGLVGVATKGNPEMTKKSDRSTTQPSVLISQPVAGVPNSANLEMIQEPDQRTTDPSVLIVENDPDLARVMITALQSRGIRAHHAVTGGEAIALCDQQEPSLIVLDPGLPDIDGSGLIAVLRESPTLLRLPLIVYSALDIERSARSLLRLGPTEFLTQSRCTLPDFERHVVRMLGIVPNAEREGPQAA